MNIWQLVFKEMNRRKLNFGLGLISVALAVMALVGSLTMLRVHDIHTREIIAKKEAETIARMAALQDDYRKIMKKLGFNLLILPKDQNLGDLYADDFASKYMPEKYVKELAAAPLMTIRHLLPSLQQRIRWPEKQRTVILIGTRGEVPFLHKNPKEPILVAVPKGSMVIGYELHSSLNLKVGDRVLVMGREFTISKTNEERGNKDDITIWVDLKTAQTMLNKNDKINAILALKCHCAGNDISKIRAEVGAILPGTHVIEQGGKVLTRAEARDRAAQEAQAAIEAEKQNRAQLRLEQEKFAAILVPLILMACAIWIALLFFANVRDRKSEIGILRAVGVRSKQILLIFLLKAVFMGIIGALLGFGSGLFLGSLWEHYTWRQSIFDYRVFVLAIVLAPLLAVIASWIPALLASQQDPAAVLREE